MIIRIVRIAILYNQDDHYRESSGCFPKILRIIMIVIKMIHMMIMIKISNRNLRFGEKKRRKSGKFSHCFKSTERGCQNLQ